MKGSCQCVLFPLTASQTRTLINVICEINYMSPPPPSTRSLESSISSRIVLLWLEEDILVLESTMPPPFPPPPFSLHHLVGDVTGPLLYIMLWLNEGLSFPARYNDDKCILVATRLYRAALAPHSAPHQNLIKSQGAVLRVVPPRTHLPASVTNLLHLTITSLHRSLLGNR